MDSTPKYLLLITGIPASGKTYLAHKLLLKFHQVLLSAKMLSTDNLQAFLVNESDTNIQKLRSLFSDQNWDFKLKQYSLNKQNFNEKIWNFSRNIVESFDILDLLFQTCSILIVEDELPLKSQRKPFKKYCSQKKMLYLEIQVHVSLEQALQNNLNRGEQNIEEKVSSEVILKSFQKFEPSPNALILSKKTILDFSSQQDILSNFKSVQIQDNYRDYLVKKSLTHEYTENEMDENQLRKLITKIIKDENTAQDFFTMKLSAKQKAQILSECKKQYIQQKRKIPFKQIVSKFTSQKFLTHK